MLLILSTLLAPACAVSRLVSSGKVALDVNFPSIKAFSFEDDAGDDDTSIALPAANLSSSRRRRRTMPMSGAPSLDDPDLSLAHEATASTSTTANETDNGPVSSSLLSADANRSNHTAVANGTNVGAAPFDYMDGGFFGSRFEGTSEVHERPFSTTGLLNHESAVSYFPPTPSSAAEPSAAFELHLREVTMHELRKSTHGSVVGFLLGLHDEFAKAKELEHFHIKVLGIHGRYIMQGKGTPDGPKPHLNNEVLVKLSVAPVQSKPGGQAWIVEAMNARLEDPENSLLETPFAFALRNASVVESSWNNLGHVPSRLVDKSEVTQVGTMLLPIAVSAGFTGVLVWLAAL